MNDVQSDASRVAGHAGRNALSDTRARSREGNNAPLGLSDVAVQQVSDGLALDWVGMEGIALPVELAGQRIEVKVNAGVSLDARDARGIHMSRLYLALEDLAEGVLTLSRLDACLARFLDSHADLSRSASLALEGRMLLKRPGAGQRSGWLEGLPLQPGSGTPRGTAVGDLATRGGLFLHLSLFCGAGTSIDTAAVRA